MAELADERFRYKRRGRMLGFADGQGNMGQFSRRIHTLLEVAEFFKRVGL